MKPTAHSGRDPDCTAIQAHLPLLVGGDLDSEATAELVRGHLAQCAACAAELAGLEAARQALASLRTERLPEIDVWSEVRAELLAAGALGAARRESSSTPAQRRRFVAMRLAAAAALVLGTGGALWMLADDGATISPESTGVVHDLAAIPPAPLDPTLADAAGGLHKIDAADALYRRAQPFGAWTTSGSSNSPWQAASFPARHDPRVR